LATLCAGLVAFVFVTGLGTVGVVSAGCAQPCGGAGGGSPMVVQTRLPAPDPCIRDAGCGGGAALATGIAMAAVLAVGGGFPSLARGVWRRWRFVPGSLVGRLVAGGLFRPPRVLFDV